MIYRFASYAALLLLITALLTSCSGTLAIGYHELPRAEMSQISSLGFITTARQRSSYEARTTSTDSAVNVRLGELRKSHGGLHKFNEAAIYLDKLENDLGQQIIQSGVYDLVKASRHFYSSNMPDAVIRLTLHEYRTVDEFVENSSLINGGVWKRYQSVNLEYELVRTRDNRILAMKNYAETSEATNGFDEIRQRISAEILRDLIPQRKSWLVQLEDDQSSAAVKAGWLEVKEQRYGAAEKIFAAGYGDSRNIACGINAALLQFYLGRREEAMSFITEVAASTGNGRAISVQQRFQEIMDNDKIIQLIGKNKQRF